MQAIKLLGQVTAQGELLLFDKIQLPPGEVEVILLRPEPQNHKDFVVVRGLTERARFLEAKRHPTYFRTQQNANIYLARKLGGAFLAGEVKEIEDFLEVDVHYKDLQAPPVGKLVAEKTTQEILLEKSDSPNRLRNHAYAPPQERTPATA